MPGTFEKRGEGFTLLELIIVISIIGILATISVPRLFKRPADRRQVFVARLNGLMVEGYQRALETGKVHRIMCDFAKGRVSLESTSKKGSPSELLTQQFDPVSSVFGAMWFDIPTGLVFRNLYVEGKDELLGGTTNQTWFFIAGDGSVQTVTFVLADENFDDLQSAVLNPFSRQFMVYDGVQKPTAA